MKPYYQDDYCTIYHGDCLEILPQLPPRSVDLLLTDPPYGKVKGEFDKEWTNRPAMLTSCEEWLAAFLPTMKANATLYWFAWPSLAGRIEALIAEQLNPLAHIIWKKPGAVAQKANAESLRAPMPETERIIMAEHYGADNIALGESGYVAKCDELRGFVFEPLRAYLAGEFKRAGLLNSEGKIAANVACGFSASAGGMASRHYFSTSQWRLPTEAHYNALRELLHLRGDWEENQRAGYLRKEYEELRKEYEELRRFFDLRTGDQKTEVWEFNPNTERFNHPTVKPLALMSFMVRLSCRPAGLVLDPFMGSGTTLRAAKDHQRRAIGIEREEKYCEIAAKRLSQEVLALDFAEGTP